MSLFVDLVRSPTDVLDRPFRDTAPRLLVGTIVGAAIFGAAIGAHHSLLQGVSAAVKMPFVLLVPPLIAAPAIHALAEALQLSLPPRRAAAAALVCVARIALFAAALAPVVWLASSLGHYRWPVACATFFLGISGIQGAMVLARAPAGSGMVRRFGMIAGATAIFGAVAAQTVWMLRPFVLRPELEVVALEHPDGDVFSALAERTRPMAPIVREAP